ncbi:MAG: S8 family serine peptidase [Pyrinomonadaceae bacterium]|nr:S8 family serine peptidase [Pyrinomonadaceae bacterium]
MTARKITCTILLFIFACNTVQAGILFSRSNGVTLTGADGVTLTGMDGVTLTGADSFLGFQSNGVTLTGADGVTLTGADGVTLTGADGVTYTGGDGVTLTGADGVTLTGADGVTLTGADGVTLTGADGTTYTADSIKIIRPDGVTLTGADGVTLTGADGVTLTGADGVTLTGADGVTLTGADGVTLTGADSIVGFGENGVLFYLPQPQGVTLTGADGVTLTGADGISITGARGITQTGADDSGSSLIPNGIRSIDPELALLLNQITDDSSVNAVIVYYSMPDAADLETLRSIGILGGTKFKVLPMIQVTATRAQILEVSTLSKVRSIYGNRTLTINSDPFFKNSGIQKVPVDRDLQSKNGGFPVSGRNVTVAVLDTGVNSLHNDLAGKVVQNVRLTDAQSAPIGFVEPLPVENVVNTDLTSGHGTFVSGIVAGSGVSSGGKYSGVAPGAKILGLGAGDLNLFHVLSGFDYILDRGAGYNVKVVNCSFSSNSVYDENDPVNVATKMLTGNGINVVVSAGNSGDGNGTLNPYAAAPWVVSVGSTDNNGKLSSFSSRGRFGQPNQNPTVVATGSNVVGIRALGTQMGTLGVINEIPLQRLTPGETPFYTVASGTSFSAPQVAGAIAMMMETNPSLTPAEVKEILQRTATVLPAYFRHEVGAGLLNSYAAVLESAFPVRKFGLYRAALDANNVTFRTTTSQAGSDIVNPGASVMTPFPVSEDTIQAGFQIQWGMSVNDLNLRIFDSQNNLVGSSNRLNAAGLLGNRESVTLRRPAAQTLSAVVNHTAGIGTAQRFFGSLETTRAEYSGLNDLDTVPAELVPIVKESVRSLLVDTNGSKFKPGHKVSRAELAESLLKSGRVLQYLSGNPVFPDVRDAATRTAVESAHADRLFFDAVSGSNFKPNDNATKLLTAIALVKAAGLEDSASTASLPGGISDVSGIPFQYRGYAAIALQRGFISLDGDKFNSTRSLTRLELAFGMVNLVRCVSQ